MKVTLVNPNVPGASTFPSGEFFSCTAPNMGIAYIAAAVEQAGHEASIIDANAFRMGEDELRRALLAIGPRIVGVTATTTTLLDAYTAARVARRTLPHAFIVMGGIHATRFPVETLEECEVLDAVSMGEGERTFVELIAVLEDPSGDLGSVKGLAYRQGSRVVMNEERPCLVDLDELPFPARHLLPMEAYSSAGHPHRTASIVSSRGCPFGCKFCAAPFIGGKRYRARSAESILDEIGDILVRFRMNTFEFVDDLFTLDKRRVFDICRGIVERGYEVNWTCSARADTVTPEMLKAMAGAGCRVVYFGIESGSQRILDLIGKRETLEQLAQAVRWTREASMRSWGFFIIGFPEETPEEIRATIQFAIDIDLDYAEFFICSAFPGSPLYERAAREGLVKKESWSDVSYGKANVENEHMSGEELEAWLIRAYRDFYTSPKVWERLRLYGQGDMVAEIVRQAGERGEETGGVACGE